ncbi:U2 small nuclear ribonucleo A -like [Paramuricea clavata]|uniref:U2 small nuclear ribonucleo A -like n=2 Tax=Paramuricea clavata TaxID=317549 RepID=A0A7D9DTQ5_PARCT|nr:U2 small nuclear ribonucleo A -like [Paramuricea clavata]
MQDLSDLESLKSIKSLRYLSLMRNPILNKPNYRLYVIHSLPQIRVLDFQRIKQREREAAARMFSGKKGEKLVNGAMRNKTNKFVPGAPLAKPPAPPPPAKKNPQRNNIAAIKAAIANAKSLEEVQKLEMMLKTGHVPDIQQPMAVDRR